jgi:hypothetical protein
LFYECRFGGTFLALQFFMGQLHSINAYMNTVTAMKKRNLALLLFLFVSTASHAGLMDPDCDAEKAAKATATKAVVGVGGRCTPKEALKDTTVEAGKDVLPNEGVAGKAVDAVMPEKEKKPLQNTTKKIISD